MASATITMGNDEFILYIRKKNKKCSLSNDQLGKEIWLWILQNSPGIDKVNDIVHDVPCHWGDAGTFIDPDKLDYSGQTEHLIPEQTEHPIPEQTEHPIPVQSEHPIPE